MIAVIGMLIQYGLAGRSAGDSAMCLASLLGALERKSGMQDPVGCWDHVDSSSDGGAE